MYIYSTELYHHGVKGMRWGVRRYERRNGTLTRRGRKRQAVRDEYIRKLESNSDSYRRTIEDQKAYLKKSDDEIYRDTFGNDKPRDNDFKNKKEAVNWARKDVHDAIRMNQSHIKRNTKIQEHIRNTSLNKKSIVEAKATEKRIKRGARVTTAILGTSMTVAAALADKDNAGKAIVKGMLTTGVATLVMGSAGSMYTDDWEKKHGLR